MGVLTPGFPSVRVSDIHSAVRRPFSIVTALVTLACVSSAPAHAQLARLFESRAPITASAGVARAPLPPEVLANSRPDLSDVRIMTADARVVPFVIDSVGRPSALREAPLTLGRIERTGRPGPYVARYTLNVPAAPETGWELVLTTAFENDHTTKLTLTNEAGDEVAQTTIYRVRERGTDIARMRVALPATLGSRFGLVLENDDGFLEPALKVVERVATHEAPFEMRIRSREEGRDRRARQFRWEAARPRGFVFDEIRIRSSATAFKNNVTVYDVDDGGERRVIGEALVYRMTDPVEAMDLSIPIARATGDSLEVVVSERSGRAPDDLDVRFVARAPAIAFQAVDAPMFLYFGGARARSGDFQESDRALAPLLDSLESRARIGATGDNPEHAAPPALSFAMTAGPVVDASAYRFVQPIRVPESPEGVSRARLRPRTLAHLGTDLRDLRVVDRSGRAFPVLLDRAVDTQVIRFTVARSGNNYTVSLPFDGSLPVISAEVDFPNSRGERLFELMRTQPEPRWLASGPVFPGQATREVLTAPARLGTQTLTLTGAASAPSALRVRATAELTDLVVAAPPGEYRLLVGREDAAASPSIPEEAHALVFAVRTPNAPLGELSANPLYEPPRVVVAGSPERMRVWIALLSAIGFALFSFVFISRRAPRPRAAPLVDLLGLRERSDASE